MVHNSWKLGKTGWKLGKNLASVLRGTACRLGEAMKEALTLLQALFPCSLAGRNSPTGEVLPPPQGTPGEASAPGVALARQGCPAAPCPCLRSCLMRRVSKEGAQKWVLCPAPQPEWGHHVPPPHRVPSPPLEQAPRRVVGLRAGFLHNLPSSSGPQGAPGGETPLRNGARGGGVAR